MAAATILFEAPSIAVTAENAPMVGATLVTSAGISTSLPLESFTIRVPEVGEPEATGASGDWCVAGEQAAISAAARP